MTDTETPQKPLPQKMSRRGLFSPGTYAPSPQQSNDLAPELLVTEPPITTKTIPRRRFLQLFGGTAATLAAGSAIGKVRQAFGYTETNQTRAETQSYLQPETADGVNFETYGGTEALTYSQIQELYATLNTKYDNGENPKVGNKLYQTVFIRESSYKATTNWEAAGYTSFETFVAAQNTEMSRMLAAAGTDGCEVRRVIVVKDDQEIPGTWQTNEQWYKTGLKDSDGTAGDWLYPNSEIYKPKTSAYYNSEKKIDYGWIHESFHFLVNLPDYYGLDVYFQDYGQKDSGVTALTTTNLELIQNNGIGYLKTRMPGKTDDEYSQILTDVQHSLTSRKLKEEEILTAGSEILAQYSDPEKSDQAQTTLKSLDDQTLYFFSSQPETVLKEHFPDISDETLRTFVQSASQTLIEHSNTGNQESTNSATNEFYDDPFARMPWYWKNFVSLDRDDISPQLYPENLVLPGKSELSNHFSIMHLAKRLAMKQMRDKKIITHETFRALPLEHLPNSVSFKFTDTDNPNRWKSTSTEDVMVTVLRTNGEWHAQDIEVVAGFDNKLTTDAKLDVGSLFKDKTRTKTLAGDPTAVRELVDMSDATYLVRVTKVNKQTGQRVDEGWRWLNWRDASAGYEPGDTPQSNLKTEMAFDIHDASQLPNWGSQDFFRANWTITYTPTEATNQVNLPHVIR